MLGILRWHQFLIRSLDPFFVQERAFEWNLHKQHAWFSFQIAFQTVILVYADQSADRL